MNSNEMISIDLPSLQSITLGIWALEGKNNDSSCSLLMRSMNVRVRYNPYQIFQISNLLNPQEIVFHILIQ